MAEQLLSTVDGTRYEIDGYDVRIMAEGSAEDVGSKCIIATTVLGGVGLDQTPTVTLVYGDGEVAC